MKTRAWLTFSLGVLLASAARGGAAVPDRVKIASGVLGGTGVQASGVRIFRGVPFAAPPIGDLRWKAPQPVAAWKGVRSAVEFGPRCSQLPLFGDMNFRAKGMSEDCLYLNVWTPARSEKERLPVLVYFYGGGFQAGDGSEPRYDGESMAAKGMVAITMNCRLGIFGFYSHPGLTQESPHKASGNYALLDQSVALVWVRQNVAAFGGDPKRVTIAGESAGSLSVSALMASPLSRDLIAGAIGESGSFLATLPPRPLAETEKQGVEFATKIGASSLAARRALSAQQLLDEIGKLPRGGIRFSANLDGHFLSKTPEAIYGAVHSAAIEYAMGNLPTNKVYAWTPEDYQVSKRMQEYFAQFIKTGDPNGPGLPKWPAVASGSAAQVMRLDVEAQAGLEAHRDRYLFLQSLEKTPAKP